MGEPDQVWLQERAHGSLARETYFINRTIIQGLGEDPVRVRVRACELPALAFDFASHLRYNICYTDPCIWMKLNDCA